MIRNAEPQQLLPHEELPPVIDSLPFPDEAGSSNTTNEDAATDCRGRKRKATEADVPEEEEEDPTRMELTDEERQWALQIKAAIEEDEEILACAVSDFEIATYAIVDRDDIERSLERALCMQAFRMQYNINDSVQEAMKIFRESEEDHPGCLLSIDECPNDDQKGCHLMVADLAKFNPSVVLEKGPKGFRTLLGSFYYMVLAVQPDLASVREGFRQVIECEGVGWNNINFKVESQKWHELLCFLPMIRKEVKVLRQPSVLACLHSFLRPVMKKPMSDKYSYGLPELDIEFPERIDRFYHQPTKEAAVEACLQRIRMFLVKRYKHERSFRL